MAKIKGKQLHDNSITQPNIFIESNSINTNNNITNKEYSINNINNKISNISQSKLNLHMTANNATVGQIACNKSVLEFPISNIIVKINGAMVNVGEGLDCYFSPDNIIIRQNGNGQKGDYLYWNSNKYDLTTDDEIDFEYLVSYQYLTLNSGVTITVDNAYKSLIVKYIGESGTTMNVIIEDTTFIVGNINGQFVWDIGGYYEHIFTYEDEFITITVNNNYYTIWFDGFGSLIFSLKNGLYDKIIKDFNIGNGFTGTTGEGIMDIFMTSDDKILCGGNLTAYNGVNQYYLTRLNTDGSLDTSFNTSFNSSVSTIDEQPDGKILVGGYFTSFSGSSQNFAIRLNSNGSKDNTFNIGTGFNATVRIVKYHPDNKILVGGNYTTFSGITTNRIIMLNSDGTRDTGFNIGTGFNGLVLTVYIQTDNKILIGGAFTTYSGITSNRIIRLNTDGTIDTGFTIGTGFDSSIFEFNIQSNGKIICVGNFTTYNGISQKYICRLNIDGSLDTSFNNQNIGVQPQGRTLLILDDDKILVGGTFTKNIIKLDKDGFIYNEFNINGSGFNNQLVSLNKTSDNKILCGGRFTTYNGESYKHIIKLNQNGSSNTISI